MFFAKLYNKFKDVTRSVSRGSERFSVTSKEKGFTLTELAASLVIITILSVILVPNLIGIIENNKLSVYESKASLVEEVVEIAYTNEGKIATVGETIVSNEVADQIKHTLSDLGVRYVDKAFNEIIDNNLIKEIDKRFLYTNSYQALDRHSLEDEPWLVIDHIDTVGADKFKYYRNELFGKVMNKEAIGIGKSNYVGTLGEYEGEWSSVVVEEITDNSITISGIEAGNTVTMYKGDLNLGSLTNDGTISFTEVNFIDNYKLTVVDSNGDVVFERDIKGVPDYSSLRMSDVKVSKGSLDGEWIINFNNDYCLDDESVCLGYDEVYIDNTNIESILINGTQKGFNFPIVIYDSTVGEEVLISVMIDGKETRPFKIYMNR